MDIKEFNKHLLNGINFQLKIIRNENRRNIILLIISFVIIIFNFIFLYFGNNHTIALFNAFCCGMLITSSSCLFTIVLWNKRNEKYFKEEIIRLEEDIKNNQTDDELEQYLYL